MKITRTIIGVAVMSVLLALYIAFAAYQAALLVLSGEPFTLVYGLALFVAPIIGIWSLFRELKFGRDAQRMLTHYIAEKGEPQLPVINRRDLEAVDAVVATPVPETWQDALVLGLTLDTVSRRREGRAMVRQAIKLWAVDSRT
ncbi:MAG: hypothetical protein NWS64_00975 [Microbacteriaceae bacterium]|nr:hypothetical protein [Microbacteriaceae bacterium]